MRISDSAVQEWYLLVGTTPGAGELFGDYVTDANGSQLVEGLPGNGVPVYVTLYYQVADVWTPVTAQYTAGVPGP